MRNIFLILVFMACGALSTQHTITQFTGNGPFDPADTVIASDNFTIDSSVSIGAFWTPAGEAYTVSQSGSQTLTLNNAGDAFKDSSSGTKTYADSIAILGNGTAKIAAASGTVDNTTNWFFTGQVTTYNYEGVNGFGIYLDDNTKWTQEGGNLQRYSFIYGGTGDTIVANTAATFITPGLRDATNMQSLRFTKPYYIQGGVEWVIIYYGSGGTDSLGLISAISTTTTINNLGGPAALVTVQQIDSIQTAGALAVNSRNAVGLTWNTNDYTVTAPSMKLGSSAGNLTIDCGASVFSLTGTGGLVQDYTADSLIMDLGSSTWSVVGPFILYEKTEITPGTSTINLTGATVCNFLDFGKPLYDVNVNKTSAAGVYGFADTTDATTLNDLTLTDGQCKFWKTISCRDYLNNNLDTVWHKDTIFVERDMTLVANNKYLGSIKVTFNTNAESDLTTAGHTIDTITIAKAVGSKVNAADNISALSFDIQSGEFDQSGVTLNVTDYFNEEVTATWSSTSDLTMDGTTPGTISVGDHFYRLTVNKTDNGVTVNGELDLDTLILTDGTWNQTNATDTVTVQAVHINTTDSVHFLAPMVVTKEITIASGAKIGWEGVGKIIMNGASASLSLNTNATCPPVLIKDVTTINDGGTINRLSFGTQGKKVLFESAKKFTFTNLDSADWSGATPILDSMVSFTSGEACTLDVPDGMNQVTSMYFKDCATPATDTINCPWDEGCRSGGGNF